MAGRKSTNAEKEWRIARVAALKARNVPTSEAVAYMTREWGSARVKQCVTSAGLMRS